MSMVRHARDSYSVGKRENDTIAIRYHGLLDKLAKPRPAERGKGVLPKGSSASSRSKLTLVSGVKTFKRVCPGRSPADCASRVRAKQLRRRPGQRKDQSERVMWPVERGRARLRRRPR